MLALGAKAESAAAAAEQMELLLETQAVMALLAARAALAEQELLQTSAAHKALLRAVIPRHQRELLEAEELAENLEVLLRLGTGRNLIRTVLA